MKNSNCKRYAQAITNSVIGEKIDVTKEELAQHLRKCPKCQKEASNWQDVCDFIRVKEYHARPEVKAKWDNFLNELTACPTPSFRRAGKLTSKPATATARVIRDAKWEIISAAEKIHDFVKDYANGDLTKKVAYPVIREETGFRDYPFHEAMSHLVTNDKLILTKGKDNRPEYVALAPSA